MHKANLEHIQKMEELKAQINELKEQAKEKRVAHRKNIDAILTTELRVVNDKKIEDRKAKHDAGKKKV